jgi:hypothetical protein
MLDFDLAEIYQAETRILNQSVKRNIERFPARFYVSTDKTGMANMSSHVKCPKSAILLAFTGHGVVLLSSVLRSEIAMWVFRIYFFLLRSLIHATSAARMLSSTPTVSGR